MYLMRSQRATLVKRQSGLGLVELMIGLLVGLIVVGAAMNILTTALTSSNDNIKMARLDQSLRQVMTMLSRDLRRATLWDGAVDVSRVSLSDPIQLSAVSGSSVSVTSSKGNLGNIGSKGVGGTLIFYDGTTLYKGTISSYASGTYSVNITTAWPADTATLDGVPAGSWTILGPQPTITKATPSAGDCLLYAYDTDASGDFTTTAPNEFFGFRKVDSEKVIKIKTASGADCSSSTTGWENLTDPDTIQITTFTIVDKSPATISSYGFNVGVREYFITITGNLKADTSITRTLQETIHVRNDNLGT